MVIILHMITAKTSFHLEKKVLNNVLLVEQSMEELMQLES